MTQPIPYRLSEVLALLPLLYVRPGDTTVAVMGPCSAMMAGEVLRWRDTVKVYALADLGIKDSRIEVVKEFPANSCHALLLSPEQTFPANVSSTLKMGGVLQACTTDAAKIKALADSIRFVAGRGTPWREYLPAPLWGVLGAVGTVPVQYRKPPKETKRLSAQYLPCLFTFGKDDLPLVFGQKTT